MNIKVKALEWVGASTMWASTPFGSYCIDRLIDKSGYVWCAPAGGWINADAIDEAQAAAKADYERRILSALEPSPDIEAVEALERANALTNAGNRTFDELTRDVTRANGEIRMALNIFHALTGAKP